MGLVLAGLAIAGVAVIAYVVMILVKDSKKSSRRR